MVCEWCLCAVVVVVATTAAAAATAVVARAIESMLLLRELPSSSAGCFFCCSLLPCVCCRDLSRSIFLVLSSRRLVRECVCVCVCVWCGGVVCMCSCVAVQSKQEACRRCCFSAFLAVVAAAAGAPCLCYSSLCVCCSHSRRRDSLERSSSSFCSQRSLLAD